MLAAASGGDEAVLDHRLEDDARAVPRGFDVGGRRIIGGRLDETGDDRGLAQAQMVGAMPEEGSRGGVDSIGAAAEIDAVEIELENLVLAELALERERKNGFLDLPHEAPVVRKEDVARELLGQRRCRADPVVLDHRGADRARKADRVDADMAAEASVFGRDDRRAHLGRDLIIGEPAAEARPERQQHLTVGGADADHLAEVDALGQLAVARQIGGSRPRRRRPARARRAAPHRQGP